MRPRLIVSFCFSLLACSACGGADLVGIPCQSSANCPTARPVCGPAGVCILPFALHLPDGGRREVDLADARAEGPADAVGDVLGVEVAVDEGPGAELAGDMRSDMRVPGADSKLTADAAVDRAVVKPDAKLESVDASVPPPDVLPACVPEPSICHDRGYTCGAATDACGTVYNCGGCGGGTPKCLAHACVCLTC